MSDSIYLYQSVSLSPSSQTVPSSSSYSLLTFPSSSLPFHDISSSASTNALDIQRFLKRLFPVTYGEMCWHTVVIYSDEIIQLYFVVYKLEPLKIHSFLQR